MILDNARRPVRPPFFLDQLANRWVADWNKKRLWRSVSKPIVSSQKMHHVTIAPDRISAAPTAAVPSNSAPCTKQQMVRTEIIHCTTDISNSTNLQMSGKMGAGKYYILTATPMEADLRDKGCVGSETRYNARTYGRKPRIDHRTVMVANFASSVSLHKVHKTFAALAAYA